MASYLFRRNGRYYFRWVIPPDARRRFGGRREIRKSLETYNRKIATTLAARLLYEMKRRIHEECEPEFEIIPEVCREITIRTDDGIEIVIDHDDPSEELRQAKLLQRN